ncbi:oxygenase MpaB family protein [Tsukamurella sp. 1534]|uniref:oxygenase MpaB family protein n=1 Tax=Tsukamurella sp. 1534 TaxID=1151061 RepID=UPI0002E8C8A5|nr:oxygenase MpaB family protein [Tsukamurella sp. 1534]
MTQLMESGVTGRITEAAAGEPRRYGPESPFVDPLGITGTAAGQWAFLPINGAAFLLQLMHPVIGDIVGEYSAAFTDPIGRAVRSMDSVQRWYFGGAGAIEEGYRLRAQHQPLQMRNADGKHISALNPEAYAWVIATGALTIADSMPRSLGRPVADAEYDRILADSHKIADIVQVPEGHVPWVRGEFEEYYDGMVEKLVAHPVAMRFLDDFAHGSPALPPETGPFFRAVEPLLKPVGITVNRAVYLLTVGVLRPEIREILGLGWTRREEKGYRFVTAAIRRASSALPERLRFTPLAYHARGQARAIQAMQGRDLPDFTAFQRQRAAGCPFG